EILAVTVDDALVDALVAAAWLHDIGYLPELGSTGFHPLDGARYLRATDWPDPVCELVAHHSGSRYVARVRELDAELAAFVFTEDTASDVLTTADNTAMQDGTFIAVTARLADKRRRHPPDSPGMRANPQRDDYILAASARVRARLGALGRTDPYLS
ncbi:MAG: hypothetical protein SW019_13345, partial [Actinomycetota bacterium]|nr:hypothetical protein [Actinomycetota bacterium]